MTWLASLPVALLVTISLVVAFAVVAISRVATRALVPPEERDHVQSIAAPLMPALGATFAVLMAMTLVSEAGYLRTAQDLVSTEAAQASRLAWAATSPGVDTPTIQHALAGYLRATRAHEWRGGPGAERAAPATALALARLERVVRAEASRPGLGTPTSTELLTSLDAVTTTRRERLAAASHEIPALYVFTLIASGAALIANAGALTCRSRLRTSGLVVGLTVVVALSMALLFALTAPWEGPLVVSGRAVDAVLRDLHTGFFHS